MYEDILHLIHRDTGKKMSPAEVVCDFEFSLISAAMEPGVLDILTVINPDLVDPKGIGWVKQEIKRKCAVKGCVYSAQEWRRFWLYFRKTWLERYFITEWNVFGITNSVVARTNNPLERFNREMNAAFKPHPNLRQFVSTIARMSSAYARKQASITRGLRRKKQRLPRIALPPVPDLTAFEVPPESDNDDVGFDESDGSLESLCSEIDYNLSLGGDTSSGEEPMGDATAEEPTGSVTTPKDSEQRIIEAANVYDNSLDWDGDQEADEDSSSDDD